jgi:NAD(P)-dependent dehydrogenase (short-subunit alcohol dehydrogenase family)
VSKTVLITGAAHGLGKATAEAFRSKGWEVIATDKDPLVLEGQGSRFVMDVASDADVQEVFSKLESRQIVIDLIVNNAGIDRYFPFSEGDAKLFLEIFNVNLVGMYRVNQVFLPLLKSPGGRIIVISSESLNLTMPFMAYPITKKAVEGYAKVLRQELWYKGIDVVILRPGAIDTGLTRSVKDIKFMVKDPDLEKRFRKFAVSAPKEIKRLLRPEEAAETIVRIAGIKRPKYLYRINNMPILRIARFIPFPWMEKIVRKRLS